MTWVSERNLVAAISNGGGFGVIACGAMNPALLRTEIQETRKRTGKPFGVNLITMHPELEQLIDVCLEERVGHVVLAGGLPPAPAIKRIREGGAKVICFAPALVLAKKLVRMGVDGLVIEGMEAGGHIGPVSTSVLAQEILPQIRDVPVFVAGGIGRGEAIVSLSRDGRRRRPARHALRLRHRVDRASALQAGLHPRRRATRCRRRSSTRASR
jgi:enoyl-[acyl-carrier protein] reductase II